MVGWVGACTCEWGGLGCGCVGGGMRFFVRFMEVSPYPSAIVLRDLAICTVGWLCGA